MQDTAFAQISPQTKTYWKYVAVSQRIAQSHMIYSKSESIKLTSKGLVSFFSTKKTSVSAEVHPVAVVFVRKFGRHLIFLFVMAMSEKVDR